MDARSKVLAKRVDQLTEALSDIRERAERVEQSHDIDEITDVVTDIGEYIDDLIGTEDDDQSSEEQDEEQELLED